MEIERLVVAVAGSDPVWQGFIGGVVTTALNAVGALLVLAWPRPSEAFLNGALSFAAGVMLTASFTGLILPGSHQGGVWPVLAGIAAGALAVEGLDRALRGLFATKGLEGRPSARLTAMWLLILAITLHNMPEGLAVGVGFGSGDLTNAVKLMLAIGIQNIPEGLAVSISALSAGRGAAFYASLVGVRAGLVEIPLALAGAWAVQAAEALLPYAQGFAAGAMLYVISVEIVPETHQRGRERVATVGLLLGVIVMVYLEIALG